MTLGAATRIAGRAETWSSPTTTYCFTAGPPSTSRRHPGRTGLLHGVGTGKGVDVHRGTRPPGYVPRFHSVPPGQRSRLPRLLPQTRHERGVLYGLGLRKTDHERVLRVGAGAS